MISEILMIRFKTNYNLINEIENLRKEVFVNELGFKLEDEFDSAETKYLHCCLCEGKELVAYARVSIQSDKARIGRIAVRKDKRKQGYGRQIMFWAETEALKNNRNNAEVHALKSAIGFYEKLGYTAVGIEFEEEGKSHILMIKHLKLDT